MHPDQVTVTAATVRALVAAQFPQWRDRPVRAVPGSGTVNAIFRVGAELAARFPLVVGDVAQQRLRLLAEASGAGQLAGRTRFATPAPVALGEPGAGYPGPWSVQTWLTGCTVATDPDLAGSPDLAAELAEFIRDVRSIPTGGRPFAGAGRGGDLRSHDGWVRTCLERSTGLLDVGPLRTLWRELRDLPRTAPDVMTHGDLIPANLLVSGTALTGVLDVGGLGPADPALDLVCAWHVFDDAPRRVLRAELGSDDLEWARGQAWAFEQALGVVRYYVDTNPAMSRMGRRTLARILAARSSR